MRLLLVRHGETIWNRERRYQGHSDVPLSDKGRAEAKAIAARLAREKIDAIYSSDLARARDTAAIIAARYGLEVKLDRRLREMCFGRWEGFTHAGIVEQFPGAERFFSGEDATLETPEGESVAQLVARVKAFMLELPQAHPEGTVALVGHGGPLQVLLCLALGLAPTRPWQFKLGHASLSELFLYENGVAILALLNDRCHLAALEKEGNWWGE